MNDIEWSVKRFDQLTIDEFHDILKLRVDVFVVEQDCPYPELDELDRPSLHVQGIRDNELIAYARIIPPNMDDHHVHIGRVVTKMDARGKGLGHELMSRSMMAVVEHFPNTDIELAAQSHLTPYYAKHGFKAIREEYPLDGIPHQDMVIKRHRR